MIKNIVFDFGDIFINLDKQAPFREMAKFGLTQMTPALDQFAKSYEMGLVESADFLREMQALFPNATQERIKAAWNSIILDFPAYRLDFIEALKKEDTYRLFLLSNTNDLHIQQVKESMGMEHYQRFQNCFERFYLSHEIKMRKPNADIYEFVLEENGLHPKESFFIDDTKENTDSAAALGIRVWNLQVGSQDIIELKTHL
ncbi:HAD family hydrolase [Maribacter sp. X9]|uniref:HAD family hydrolase n=1 Tax=Maribacter sp. X9 TaxID=3402159 RepID=UPI003AF39266